MQRFQVGKTEATGIRVGETFEHRIVRCAMGDDAYAVERVVGVIGRRAVAMRFLREPPERVVVVIVERRVGGVGHFVEPSERIVDVVDRVAALVRDRDGLYHGVRAHLEGDFERPASKSKATARRAA